MDEITEDKREAELEEFNKGPTAGTLNDKRRLAFIYEEILNLRDRECPNCGLQSNPKDS